MMRFLPRVGAGSVATILEIAVSVGTPETRMSVESAALERPIAVEIAAGLPSDHDRAVFVSQIKRGIESVQADMKRLEVRAKQKGRASVDALGPHLRTYQDAKDAIEVNLQQIEDARDGDDWVLLRTSTEQALADARQALVEGRHAVDKSPPGA